MTAEQRMEIGIMYKRLLDHSRLEFMIEKSQVLKYSTLISRKFYILSLEVKEVASWFLNIEGY